MSDRDDFDLPPRDEPDWIEDAGERPDAYPPHPSNAPHFPRGTVFRFLLALLLCLAAGVLATAGLRMRSSTLLGWLLIVIGAFLIIPASRLAVRSILTALIVLNQMGKRDRD